MKLITVMCYVVALTFLMAVHETAAASSQGFLQLSGTEEAERSLHSELANNVSEFRLERLEEMLLPTYTALPKDEDGHMSHQTVRYVLHRLFVQQYGWYVRGLEPNDEAPPPYMQGEWVPSYLQGLLEQRFGSNGIDLKELAALAAAMEDLAFKESSNWLDIIYGLLYLQNEDRLNQAAVEQVVSTYMMVYLRGGAYSELVPSEVQPEMIYFASQYTDWPKVVEFLKRVEMPFTEIYGDLDYDHVARVVDEVAKKFYTLNDDECQNLKASLTEVEDKRAGRVLLSEFYRKGLYSHWEFNEKIAYLRTLGALDESNPVRPRVIIPNYISSRTNCLKSSSLYLVCCRNECEDLMGHLEREIAKPMAKPAQILELISELPSDTVHAPRNLSGSLLTRLSEIAESHGGEVPIHGRLFAQWMHHAYPRECPYPHEANTTSPMTPDQWISQTGEENSKATEEEMKKLIGNETCNLQGPCNHMISEEGGSELPWNDVEELLHVAKIRMNMDDELSVSADSALVALLPLQFLWILAGVLLPGGLYYARKGAVSEDKLDQEKSRRFLIGLPWAALVLIAKVTGVLRDDFFLVALCAGLVLLVVLPLANRFRKVEHCVNVCKVEHSV